MEQKSRIVFLVFFGMIAASVVLTFDRAWIQKDYYIEMQVGCDPHREACFVHICDPSTEECQVDESNNISYYKILHRNAGNIPLCDPADEDCMAEHCFTQEPDCYETLCDQSVVPEGELCNDPAVFTDPVPPEESVPADVTDVPERTDAPVAPSE